MKRLLPNRSALHFAALSALALLSACTSGTTGSTGPSRIPVNPPKPDYSLVGLEAVMGSNAGQLVQMFGEPRLDVVEISGRKLQFLGKPCILDAYLYSKERGGQEVVTHVDARNSDGAAVDRAACVAALRKR